jgi:hypothetical protein
MISRASRSPHFPSEGRGAVPQRRAGRARHGGSQQQLIGNNHSAPLTSKSLCGEVPEPPPDQRFPPLVAVTSDPAFRVTATGLQVPVDASLEPFPTPAIAAAHQSSQRRDRCAFKSEASRGTRKHSGGKLRARAETPSD